MVTVMHQAKRVHPDRAARQWQDSGVSNPIGCEKLNVRELFSGSGHHQQPSRRALELNRKKCSAKIIAYFQNFMVGHLHWHAVATMTFLFTPSLPSMIASHGPPETIALRPHPQTSDGQFAGPVFDQPGPHSVANA